MRVVRGPTPIALDKGIMHRVAGQGFTNVIMQVNTMPCGHDIMNKYTCKRSQDLALVFAFA